MCSRTLARSNRIRHFASGRYVCIKSAGRPVPCIQPWSRFYPPEQAVRGKKTKSTITLDDKQGLIEAESAELIEDDDGPIYPTVVRQARNNMRKFSNCVLLTRVGNFYEVISSFRLEEHALKPEI